MILEGGKETCRVSRNRKEAAVVVSQEMAAVVVSQEMEGVGEAGGGHVVRDSSHHQEFILDARRNL